MWDRCNYCPYVRDERIFREVKELAWRYTASKRNTRTENQVCDSSLDNHPYAVLYLLKAKGELREGSEFIPGSLLWKESKAVVLEPPEEEGSHGVGAGCTFLERLWYGLARQRGLLCPSMCQELRWARTGRGKRKQDLKAKDSMKPYGVW